MGRNARYAFRLAQAAENYGVSLWQSEWSMLGDGYNSSEFKGFRAATEMDIALYMSKVIHNDLTVAGVSSWSFWTSMDVARWGHKNRFLLVSLVPADGIFGDIRKREHFKLLLLSGYSEITQLYSPRLSPYQTSAK